MQLKGQTITLSHQDHVRTVLTSSKRSVWSAPLANKNTLYQNRLTPTQSKRIHSSYTQSTSLFEDANSNLPAKDDHDTVSFSKEEKLLEEEVNLEGEKLKSLVIRIPSSQSGYS